MAKQIDDMPTEALPKRAAQDIQTLLSAMQTLKPEHVMSKTMYYGDPGSGKTTQAMEFAQALRKDDEWILYFDTGQGWTSLMNRPELMKNVRRVKFENMEQLRLYAEYARNPHPKIQEIFSKMSSVVFDEFSNMTDRDLRWVVRVRSEQAAKKGDFKDPHTPAFPDYHTQKIRAGEVINDYMDLDCHVFFICHAKYEKETGKIGPDMPNKLAQDIVRLVHGLYYATVVEDGDTVNYGIQTDARVRTKPPRQAKNRINKVPTPFASNAQIIECYKQWGISDKPNVDLSPVGKEPEQETVETDDATDDNVDVENLDSLLS